MKKLSFKNWLEGLNQGGIEPEKEKIPVTAMNVTGFNSDERPPTKKKRRKPTKWGWGHPDHQRPRCLGPLGGGNPVGYY